MIISLIFFENYSLGKVQTTFYLSTTISFFSDLIANSADYFWRGRKAVQQSFP